MFSTQLPSFCCARRPCRSARGGSRAWCRAWPPCRLSWGSCRPSSSTRRPRSRGAAAYCLLCTVLPAGVCPVCTSVEPCAFRLWGMVHQAVGLQSRIECRSLLQNSDFRCACLWRRGWGKLAAVCDFEHSWCTHACGACHVTKCALGHCFRLQVCTYACAAYTCAAPRRPPSPRLQCEQCLQACLRSLRICGLQEGQGLGDYGLYQAVQRKCRTGAARGLT